MSVCDVLLLLFCDLKVHEEKKAVCVCMHCLLFFSSALQIDRIVNVPQGIIISIAIILSVLENVLFFVWSAL